MARMGRPPIPAEERRGERITVRFTDEERAELERVAQVAGLPIAEWIRTAALRAARRRTR